MTLAVIELLVTLSLLLVFAVALRVTSHRAAFGRARGPLELLGRLPLDPRRTVYLVRVGESVFVVGGSEGGLTKLGEVPRLEVNIARDGVPSNISFSATLAGLMQRISLRKSRPLDPERAIDPALGGAAESEADGAQG